MNEPIQNSTPEIQNTTPKTNYKLVTAWIIVGIIFLAMVGLFIYQSLNKNKSNNSSVSNQNSTLSVQNNPSKEILSQRKDNSKPANKLLIHTINGDGGTLYLYDMEAQKVVASSTLVVGNEYSGGIDFGSVYEFNPHTGDVFYLTQGASDYDGACVNSDGTCTDRLYKYNLYSGKETKLKDLKSLPSQWVLNNTDGYLYLSFLTQNQDKTWKQSIVKIDPISGAEESFFEQNISASVGLKELVVSSDGNFLYQALENTTNHNGTMYNGVALNIINIKDRSLEQKEIFKASNDTDYLFLDTNISPNGQYFAYWLNFNLEIYDFQTGKTVTIPREPGPTPPLAGAIWSTDNKRLFYGFGGFPGIRYYDTDLNQIVNVKNIPLVNSYPLQVHKASNRFMIYDGGNEEYYLHLYDLRSEKLISLPEYIKKGGIISDWIE